MEADLWDRRHAKDAMVADAFRSLDGREALQVPAQAVRHRRFHANQREDRQAGHPEAKAMVDSCTLAAAPWDQLPLERPPQLSPESAHYYGARAGDAFDAVTGSDAVAA